MLTMLILVSGFAVRAGVFQDPNGPIEERYQDAIVTLLSPVMDREIQGRYADILYDTPGFDFATTEFISISRPNGYRTGLFRVVIEVMPFLGPHLSVGKDRFCIEFGYGQEPEVIEFTHLCDYPLPEHYQHEYR